MTLPLDDTPFPIDTVLHGDCLDVMRGMEDCSVHAIVTDPPYGLSKEPDMVEVLTHWLAGDEYKHKHSGFMGKSWDSFCPGPEFFREMYRVLKPGGYLLCFAGTRSWDLMSIAIRLAGFENRDTIASQFGVSALQWQHGQGFPKSIDVGKQIDKLNGAEREVIGQKWMSYSDSSRPSYNSKGHDIESMLGLTSPGSHRDITAPATPEAAQWDGWQTALKPSWEPILMFRKPLSEPTVAQNVLTHGTGAINIEKCRVGYTPAPKKWKWYDTDGGCSGRNALHRN